MRVHQNWIDTYISYTDNTEPRVSYRLWSGLSAIAAALQRKCFLVLGSETFYPNLYVILTGPPAARKGTALRPAIGLLRTIGIPLAADEASRQKLVTALLESDNMHSDDAGNTYIHSSLTIIASELTVFLGYQNIDFLAVLCKWYDCEDRFIYDTHSHGKQEVSNVWVNILGATTPMMIQASLPVATFGSGFASRTMFIHEETKAAWIAAPSLRVDLEEGLIRDLGEMSTLCGQFKCNDEFYSLYRPWYESGGNWKNSSEPRLEFYAQRRHVQLLKLCMLYSAARGNSLLITADDFNRALDTIVKAERRMADAFRGFGTNPMAALQLRVMKVIAEEKCISYKALMKMFFEDTDSQGLSVLLATLSEMDFCKIDSLAKKVYYTEKKDES